MSFFSWFDFEEDLEGTEPWMLLLFVLVFFLGVGVLTSFLPNLRSIVNQGPAAWILRMRTGFDAFDVVERHEMDMRLSCQEQRMEQEHQKKLEKEKAKRIIEVNEAYRLVQEQGAELERAKIDISNQLWRQRQILGQRDNEQIQLLMKKERMLNAELTRYKRRLVEAQQACKSCPVLQEDLRLRQEVLKMRDQKHASELAKVEEAHCSRYMDLEKAHEVVKAEVKSLREASDKVAKEQMERAMRIYGAELALEAALTENAELKEQMDAQHAAFLVQLSQPSEVADTTELDAIKEENRNLRMDYQNALARHQDQAERLMDLCRKYQKFAVLKGVKTKDARSRQSSKLRKAVASAKTRRPAEPVHLMADASTNTDSTTELQRCTLVGPVTVAEIVPSPELSTTLSLTVVPEVDSLMADEVPVYTGPIADASMDDVVPVYTGPIADTPVADEVPVYTGPIADASMADEVAVNTVPIADILVADEVPVYTGPIVHASVADEVSEPITNASQADEVPVNTGPIAPTTAPPYMPVPFFQQPPPTQPTAAISLAPPYMPYQMAVAQRLGVGLYSSPTQMPLFTEPQVVPYLHPENAAAAERRVAELFEYPSPTSATFSGPYFFQQAPLAVPKVYSRKRKQPESDVTEGVREKELDDELERAHEKQRKLDEEREIREQAEAMLKMAGLVESSVESDEDAEDDATAGRGLQGAEAAAAAAAPSPPPPPPPPPPAPSTSTIDMSTLDPALSS